MSACGCSQLLVSLGVQFFKHEAFPGLVWKQVRPATLQHPVLEQSSSQLEHWSREGKTIVDCLL